MFISQGAKAFAHYNIAHPYTELRWQTVSTASVWWFNPTSDYNIHNLCCVAIIIIILIAFTVGSFIAGFKVDYNITGVERERIGYNREYSSENI